MNKKNTEFIRITNISYFFRSFVTALNITIELLPIALLIRYCQFSVIFV